MKKTLGWLVPVLALIVPLAFPAALGIGKLTGYTYALRSALLYVLICLALAFASLFFSGEEQPIAGKAAALLILPAACVSGIFLHIGCESEWVSHCVLALVIVSLVLFVMTKATWKIKVPLGVLSLIPLLYTLFFCLLSFIPISEKTEMACVSPDGAYVAKLSVVDEGALGGDRVIWVYPTATVKQGILGEWKQEKEIYRGDWIEAESISFSWADERMLLLNGESIPIL